MLASDVSKRDITSIQVPIVSLIDFLKTRYHAFLDTQPQPEFTPSVATYLSFSGLLMLGRQVWIFCIFSVVFSIELVNSSPHILPRKAWVASQHWYKAGSKPKKFVCTYPEPLFYSQKQKSNSFWKTAYFF